VRNRRARWLLISLVLAQLVLVSRQLARSEGERPLLERATLQAVGPLAGAVDGVGSAVRGVGEGWRTRGRLSEENQQLRERLAELERELMRRGALEQDFQRLAGAVRYSRALGLPLQMADVVYADHASWLRNLVLYVGDQSAERNQPVVDQRGLVGRVVVQGRPYAKVQLITDRASAVGVMIERTRRQGVLKGSGEGELLLDYLPLQADVQAGDRVVTAGIDGIYPRGLAVGVVRSVEPGSQLFHRIEVAPAVDFGVLDHVYLLPASDAGLPLVDPGPEADDALLPGPATEDPA
jgi:rod shape-determining protein MreC